MSYFALKKTVNPDQPSMDVFADQGEYGFLEDVKSFFGLTSLAFIKVIDTNNPLTPILVFECLSEEKYKVEIGQDIEIAYHTYVVVPVPRNSSNRSHIGAGKKKSKNQKKGKKRTQKRKRY
jgi:hypothetical protein